MRGKASRRPRRNKKNAGNFCKAPSFLCPSPIERRGGGDRWACEQQDPAADVVGGWPWRSGTAADRPGKRRGRGGGIPPKAATAVAFPLRRRHTGGRIYHLIERARPRPMLDARMRAAASWLARRS
ncbi:hypothetical protein SEVIR_2G238767v4 [Setaria viridis]